RAARFFLVDQIFSHVVSGSVTVAWCRRCCGSVSASSADDRVDVALAEDHQFAAIEVDLGAAVLGEHDGVADAHFERLALAVVEDLARSYGEHGAALALLLGAVR